MVFFHRYIYLTLFLLQSVVAVQLHSCSFVSPFGSFDSAGKRRVVGWRTVGSSRVKMGAVALTLPQPGEQGSVWSSKSSNFNKEFSIETKFRISGTNKHENGETLAWFIVNDSTVLTETDFFGITKRFQGLAIVISINHPAAKGDSNTDSQKLTLYANNGGAEPTELASCLRPFYYDENRDDFVPSHASTMRVTYKEGRVIIDLDPRNTQRWFRCLTTARITTVIPDASSAWREKTMVGIIGTTHSKRTRFEIVSFRMFDRLQDAMELAAPDWNGAEGDRALNIAHQLEHGLFEVKDSIEKMLDQLAIKAQRDAQRIEELEDKLANSAFALMESRIVEVEKRLTSISTPIVEARVRQVELRANHRLQTFKSETDSGSQGWLRPFLVVFGMLAVFAFYSHREFRTMNKWNKNLMTKS